MILQVITVEIFDENAQKKNIKGRVYLSDGVSKLLVMISDKAYNAVIQTGADIEQYSVWALNVAKQQVQQVKNTP